MILVLVALVILLPVYIWRYFTPSGKEYGKRNAPPPLEEYEYEGLSLVDDPLMLTTRRKKKKA